MPRGGRVVEVRHHGQPMAASERSQEIAVVLGENDGLRQLPHVGSQEERERLGRQLGRVEAETPEHEGEALRRRHFAVVLAAEALRLLPAPEERLHEVLEGEAGGVGLEHAMEVPGSGAPRLALDLDLGQARAVEEDEGVEEIEEHGGGLHGSGLRLAYPSSKPCQKRTASSPCFQQRFTGCDPAWGMRQGKSTSPISRSLVTPPSSPMRWSTCLISMA